MRRINVTVDSCVLAFRLAAPLRTAIAMPRQCQSESHIIYNNLYSLTGKPDSEFKCMLTPLIQPPASRPAPLALVSAKRSKSAVPLSSGMRSNPGTPWVGCVHISSHSATVGLRWPRAPPPAAQSPSPRTASTCPRSPWPIDHRSLRAAGAGSRSLERDHQYKARARAVR